MSETYEQRKKRMAEERRRRQQNQSSDAGLLDPLNPIFNDPSPATSNDSPSWGGFSGGDSGNAGASDSFGGCGDMGSCGE